MPQLGFNNVVIGGFSAKKQEVVDSGLLIILGAVGDIRGNVVYTVDFNAAKTIASTMMMGAQVIDLDDMAKSALGELANMLTAHAATAMSKLGILIEISTPTLLHGENMCVNMHSDQILCVRLLADNLAIDVNVSFEK